MNDALNRERASSRLSLGPSTFAICLLALAFTIFAPSYSYATEIVPSYGLTKSVDADEVKGVVGLALRGNLIPNWVQTEIGANYRREDVADGALHIRQWPITASILVTPLNVVYASAGVGWYHTTFDYEDEALDDDTEQDFGIHLGGGLKVPVAPRLALDLGGRYVMMRDQETKLIPETFNPDFWTLALGLAVKF